MQRLALKKQGVRTHMPMSDVRGEAPGAAFAAILAPRARTTGLAGIPPAAEQAM
jgi:hypothetical protein